MNPFKTMNTWMLHEVGTTSHVVQGLETVDVMSLLASEQTLATARYFWEVANNDMCDCPLSFAAG